VSTNNSGLRAVAVAWKRLAAVEMPGAGSNQHEFNGTKPLEAILGTPTGKETVPTRFMLLGDEIGDSVACMDHCTWYDARSNHPTRSELRLFYRANAVTGLMQEGDLAIFFKRGDGSLAFVVVKAGTKVEAEVIALFDIETVSDHQMRGLSPDQVMALRRRPLLTSLAIELGIVEEDQSAALIQQAMERFDGKFPSTLDMALFARETIEMPAGADADMTLELLVAHEEIIFRGMERIIVERELKDNIHKIEPFIDLALGVINRRKSRAGNSLQHHLQAVLEAAGLELTPQGRTEGKNRPDFLLPGERQYRDRNWPDARLAMIAVKRTLKDRWRQILTEANRIPEKHLVTLEPSISESQLEEMRSKRVLLVVPKGIHGTYAPHLRTRLMTVEGMIEDIRMRITP
jgi:hypothetical protein